MYEDWCTIDEAIKRTGLSERTLYRRMKDPHNPVRNAYRRIPGRKPLLVLNPDDVARLESETAKPILEDGPLGLPAMLAANPDKAKFPDTLTRAAEHWMLKNKPILTLDEAAQLSGYTRTYLEKAYKRGDLAAFRDGSIKVHRDTLHQFVATDRVALSAQKPAPDKGQRIVTENGAPAPL